MKIIPFDRKIFKLINRLVLVLLFILLFIIACKTIYVLPSMQTNAITEITSSESNYIKWVDNNLTLSVMEKVAKLDIDSHVNNESIKYNWIELISYLACKYGNNFKSFKQKDLDDLVSKLKSGKSIETLTSNMKNYNYYFISYNAILKEFIGEYEIEKNNELNEKIFEKKYGIKAFLPIAKGYNYTHYDDFGNSRSYGYKRIHLGNDLMGSIGTPIIAVESGTIEALSWNQYGGWRIGIRSFDKTRYYYYAHLRKNHPYAKDLYEGKVVKAGDVIGYLGMTGYSSDENVNNVNVPHLHFGMQLIFNEVQKDGVNQIWIDVYEIINFLRKNTSEVYYAHTDTKDYERKYDFMEKNIYD